MHLFLVVEIEEKACYFIRMSVMTTKKAIAGALKELLLEKPINKITVSDITTRCEINRQTFYYHFQDIRDLVEWICVYDADKVLADKKKYDTWQDGFLAVFQLMLDDKPFIMNIYHSVSVELLTNHLYRLVFPTIYSVVDEKSQGKTVREEDKEFITDFYKYAFVAIVLDWIKKGMKEDPKEIVNRVSSLVEGTIDNAINNIRKSNV